MVSQTSSAVLQRHIRNARRDLNEHADQMVAKARIGLDWRRYVANHPWTSLGTAAVAGFFLAPRRTCCKSVDAATVKKTVDQVVRAAQPPAPSAISNIVGSVTGILATTLIREGATLVSQLARHWLEGGRPPHTSAAERANGKSD
jgi:hypothetical protein